MRLSHRLGHLKFRSKGFLIFWTRNFSPIYASSTVKKGEICVPIPVPFSRIRKVPPRSVSKRSRGGRSMWTRLWTPSRRQCCWARCSKPCRRATSDLCARDPSRDSSHTTAVAETGRSQAIKYKGSQIGTFPLRERTFLFLFLTATYRLGFGPLKDFCQPETAPSKGPLSSP